MTASDHVSGRHPEFARFLDSIGTLACDGLPVGYSWSSSQQGADIRVELMADYHGLEFKHVFSFPGGWLCDTESRDYMHACAAAEKAAERVAASLRRSSIRNN